MNKTVLLFVIILIEGYVVLASELLAIRELIPFVGSGTETVSIIISAILLPLAVGYHFGGQAFARQYARARQKKQKPKSIRAILLRNIISALLIFSLGLSYIFMEFFFGILTRLGMHHRLAQTTLYSLLFLVVPVFLLGQTVPLVSNYFSRQRLSEITGKMLFFSTTGSFLGSVFSTIVLMMTIGVHNTVIVTMGLLVVLVLLLVRRWFTFEVWLALFIMGVLFAMNSTSTLRSLGIVSNNAYNTVSVNKDPHDDEGLILNINRSNSSKISKDPNKNFLYIRYLKMNFIDPMNRPDQPVRDVLIIGAGGFTLGLEDQRNHYTYVDIDPDLKKVAETHFIQHPLGGNKQFIAASAREFVRNHDKQYDLILIDTFTNIFSIPMETTTAEFLKDSKKLLKQNGVLLVNVVMHPDFSDRFSVRYDHTFASVFPTYSRQILGMLEPWATKEKQETYLNNVIYIYFDRPLVEDRAIYTDDKNSYSIDRY